MLHLQGLRAKLPHEQYTSGFWTFWVLQLRVWGLQVLSENGVPPISAFFREIPPHFRVIPPQNSGFRLGTSGFWWFLQHQLRLLALPSSTFQAFEGTLRVQGFRFRVSRLLQGSRFSLQGFPLASGTGFLLKKVSIYILRRFPEAHLQ